MAGASKASLDGDKWPVDGGPLPFEFIADAVVHAIRCAYTLERKDRRRNVPWHGPEIGQDDRANCPLAASQLKAAALAYAEEDQGRDALDEIVGLAIRLGIEQGRRISKSSHCDLLDKTYGVTFTLTLGWDHTHLHTQSGLLSDPEACIGRAIMALEEEKSVISRCPRHRAVMREGEATTTPGTPK